MRLSDLCASCTDAAPPRHSDSPLTQTVPQAESLWLHLPLITEMAAFNKRIYTVSKYAFVTIPTYPSGQIGFFVCSNGVPTP
jgi:spermidine synthase / saccharopine dehydrogenase (NADP+, L-glutamate-forming)